MFPELRSPTVGLCALLGLLTTLHAQEILPLNGVPDSGSGLDGRYWQAGVKTLDNLDDKGGAKDIGLKIIRGAHPTGVFKSTGLSYQGGNDLTPIRDWLQADGDSYDGAEGNMDDGLLSFTGYLRIDAPGDYDIRSESDDGSILWIAGERVIDNDGSHGAPGPSPDGFYNFATAGLYPIEIAWFNGDWTNDAGDHGGANLNILLDGAPVTGDILYGAGDVGAAAISISSLSAEKGDAGLAGRYWASEPKGFEFGEGAQGPVFQTSPGDDHGIYMINSEPDGSFVSTNVNYTGNDLTPIVEWLAGDGASFQGNEGNLDDGMVQLRGLIDITSAGWHDFNSSSDDGSVIRVGNQVVVNNDGGHGAPGPAPDGSAFFTKAGLYPIEVNWFNGDWTNDAGDHGGANIHLTMDGEALEGLLYHSLEEGITLPSLVKAEPVPLPTILLESFETSTTESLEENVRAWAGDRTTYGVADLSADDSLVGVTDGNQALEVNFDTLSGWAQDFQILLSPEASALLEEKWNEDVPHRWWLLYDITFGSGGGNWANNPVWVGDASYGDQVEVNGAWDTPVTAYIEIDSVRNGIDLLPDEQGQIAIGFGFNGDLSEESQLWVDNIRLLDTYAAGYEPVETLLDGLEGPDFDLITESGFALYDYARQEADDPRVTQGDGAAWIEVDGSGWTTAAVIELSQSDALNEVLATVEVADRVHYTLSYDFIVIPDANTAVSWFQTIPSVTGSRLSPNWAGEMIQRTTSINLGSVEWGSPAPNINLVTQGGFDGYVDVFVDNIRLFNAKGNRVAGPEPMDPPALTGVQSSGGQIEIEFASVSGGSYSILVSEDLASGAWSEAASGITATGASTSWQDAASGAQKFYRIRRDQ